MTKVYQDRIIQDVLSACSFPEVKNAIDKTFSRLKKQHMADEQLMKLVDDTVNELEILHQTRLPYDQCANIITARVHLKELQLKMLNVIN
jgi:hypothetical protein